MKFLMLCLVVSTSSSCALIAFGGVMTGLAIDGEATAQREGAARTAHERIIAAKRAEVLRERYRASEARNSPAAAAEVGALSPPPLMAAEPARKPLKPLGSQ